MRAVVTSCLWVVFFVGVAAPPHALTHANIERIVWLAADATVVGFIILYPARMLGFVRRQPVMLAWCLLAMLSALWSHNPGISIYHGIQLLMTVLVAAMLCLTKPLDEILVIIFTSLVIAALMSLSVLVIRPAAAFDINGAFRGMLHHKNELGSLMMLLLLTGTTLFAAGHLRLLALATMALATLVLLLTRSGASVLMTAIWLGPLILAATYQMGPRAFSVAAGLTCLVAGLGVFAVVALDIDVEGAILGSVGKDKTLTGRTLLWSIAWDAFLQHPLLGFGFKGYWESPLTSANYLRIASGQDLWFFHNAYLEIAVALGVAGPVLLVAGLAMGLKQGIARYVADRSFITLWSPLLIICLFVACMVENPLFVNHNPWQVLLVVALGARAREARTSLARRPRPGRAYPGPAAGEGSVA